MSVYVIGDVHGCYTALMALLTDISFDPSRDQLWFTGDLVNRGEDSWAVLSFLRQLPAESVFCVLGNHDIYALMCWHGVSRETVSDSLRPVIQDDESMRWLQSCPLWIEDGRDVLVHAGCLPGFSLSRLAVLARDAEDILRGPQCSAFLSRLYDVNEQVWSDQFDEMARFRFTLNILTRLRLCSPRGAMNFFYKGAPKTTCKACWRPWFDLYPIPTGRRIFFGHWSQLGLVITPQYCCLDSGCVWGGALTAFRKDDNRLFQVPAVGSQDTAN